VLGDAVLDEARTLYAQAFDQDDRGED